MPAVPMFDFHNAGLCGPDHSKKQILVKGSPCFFVVSLQKKKFQFLTVNKKKRTHRQSPGPRRSLRLRLSTPPPNPNFVCLLQPRFLRVYVAHLSDGTPADDSQCCTLSIISNLVPLSVVRFLIPIALTRSCSRRTALPRMTTNATKLCVERQCLTIPGFVDTAPPESALSAGATCPI